MKKYKKLVTLLFCCLFLLSTVTGATLKYDSKGNIYFDYGTRKYTDEEIVDQDTFDKITIFSAIAFGDWPIIQKELDSGLDINSRIILNDAPFIIQYTPFSYALTHNTLSSEKKYRKSSKESTLNKLIEAGANVNYEELSIVFGKQRNIPCLILALMEFANGTLSKDFVMTMIDKVERIPVDSYFQIATTGDVEIIKAGFEKIKSYDDTPDSLIEFLMASIYYPCLVAHNDNKPIPDYVVDYCLEIQKMPFVHMNIKQITDRFFTFNNGNGLYETISTKYANDENWQDVLMTFELLKRLIN